MKRFLLNFFAFAGVVGLLTAAVVCGVLPRIKLYTAPFGGWHQRCLSVHQPSDKPRLILVGGSNLSCGIDGAMLSRELGERFYVVNLGFHAGLGVGVHLDLIDDGLMTGDVVVLMVEYTNWSRWNGGLPATVFRCDVQDRNLFTSMIGSKWGTVDLAQWHHYIMEKWHRCAGGTQLFSEPNKEATVKSRQVASNEATEADRPDPHYAKMPVYLTGRFKLDDLSRSMLMKLLDSYRRRGVKLLLSAPSYDARHYALHASEIEQIYAMISTQIGIPQISDPKAFSFPLSEMGDTGWHLNRLGREKMTRKLASDICSFLQLR